MRRMFTKTILSTLGEDALTRAANRVYEEYVVPAQLTVEQAMYHVRANDVRLDASPLWLDAAGETVGMGFLGVRGTRGWIGGFGIAPAYRGRRLSRPLAEEMLQRAAGLGLAEVQLEVITRNPYAIRTYERVGFVTRRELRVFVRPARHESVPMPEGVAAAADPDAALTAAVAAAGTRAPAPCWQREPRSILGRGGFAALVAGPAAAPHACVIYTVTPTVVRVAHLWAADPAGIPALLHGLQHLHPALGIAVTNEPVDSACCAPLEAAGFEERLRQHEMVVRLAD